MRKEVFFLGAGFSKAVNFNYPLLKELTDTVNSNFINKYSQSALKAHFDEIPDTLKINIEQLLTYLSSDCPWTTSIQKDMNTALYKALTKEISNYIEDIETTKINQNIIDFIKYINGRESPIITLNYDTLLESLSSPHSLIQV